MSATLKERLKDFLMNRTDEVEFTIATEDVAKLGPEEVAAVNEILESSRRLNGSDGFRVEPARATGEAIKIAKDPKMNEVKGRTAPSIYSGAPDARQSASSEGAAPDNPFRPRYRKLAQNELDHHDALKGKAMELLEAFREIPTVRAIASQATTGEEHANIKLAQRHLEDAVYRAVKALTA